MSNKAAFEVWYIPRYEESCESKTCYGRYMGIAWKAWQAALKLERERQASSEAKSHAEMLQIHEIVMSIDECPPILESDSYLVKAVKNMAYMINQTSKTDIESFALHERDKLCYTVVKVIEKLDEINEQAQECVLDDIMQIAISLDIWHELQDALEEMLKRAELSSIPESVKDLI